MERIINKYIFAFFILLLFAFLFVGLKEFLNGLLGAIVFYVLFKNWMFYFHKKKKLNESLAAAIVMILSFLFIVLPCGFLGGMFYTKISKIAQDPEQIKQMAHFITEKINHLPFNFADMKITEKATTFITQNMGVVLSSFVGILSNLVMMYFFLYFFLVNANNMEAKIIHFLPIKKAKITLFGKELVDQTYSNAIGVPVILLIQGLFAYLAYMICGIPDALLWAVLTGFAGIIPLVGTTLIWGPVSIFLFAEGEIWKGVFIIVYCAVLLTNIDNLVRMIISKRVGDVHPVITVLGVILGLKFFGIVGLVFGPLFISYFVLLLRLFYWEYYAMPANVDQIVEKKNMLSILLSKFSTAAPQRNVDQS